MWSQSSLDRSNYQLSASCGAFSKTAPGSYDITNLSVSIRLSGNRYVWVGLIADQSGSESYLKLYNQAAPNGHLFFYRDTTEANRVRLTVTGSTGGSTGEIIMPCSALHFIERPAAGIYTYKAQLVIGGTTYGDVSYARLFAIEMRF